MNLDDAADELEDFISRVNVALSRETAKAKEVSARKGS
jgi:hypothetical protein